jgi:pilus assembly protein Flp/PilA
MTSYVCSQLAASLSAGIRCAPAVPRIVSGLLPELIGDESGQDMIEYALVAATIGLGTVAGVHGLASSVANYLNIVDGKFDSSIPHH